jgi:hypothetical protein
MNFADIVFPLAVQTKGYIEAQSGRRSHRGRRNHVCGGYLRKLEGFFVIKVLSDMKGDSTSVFLIHLDVVNSYRHIFSSTISTNQWLYDLYIVPYRILQ